MTAAERQPLRAALDRSISGSTVIQDTDELVVEAARMLADHLDNAVNTLTGPDLTKALYLTPHLLNVTRELLLSPASRIAAKIADVPRPTTTVGKLRAQNLREEAPRRRA